MKDKREKLLEAIQVGAKMLDMNATPADRIRPNINPVNKELNEKRNRLDTIYIESEDRMMLMMNWYFDNLEGLKELEYKTPILEGVIEEPNILYMFENKGNYVDFHVFLNAPEFNWSRDVEFASFKYDPVKEKVLEETILKSGSKIERQKAQLMVHAQNMFPNKGLVYKALMYFMAYYEGEIIEIDESKNVTRNKREARKIKRLSGSPIPLVKKTYVIKKFDAEKIRLPGASRPYTKPDHEVRYRGHWRHLKSGKTVWVKERSAYSDKGKTKPKNYKV